MYGMEVILYHGLAQVSRRVLVYLLVDVESALVKNSATLVS